MKITDLRIILTQPNRKFVIVKLLTDVDGLYGIGDATSPAREMAVKGVMEKLRDRVVGIDPQYIEAVRVGLMHDAPPGDPAWLAALSGIDMALWDLKGKALGRPVYDLLGGRSREWLRCHVPVPVAVDVPEAAVDTCLTLREQGFTAFRLMDSESTGATRRARIQRGPGAGAYTQSWRTLFHTLRESLGDDVDLIHSPRSGLTPAEFVRVSDAVQPFHPYWVEVPSHGFDTGDLAYVRARSHVPLASSSYGLRGESEHEIMAQRLDYVGGSATLAGGISQIKRLAAVAETYDVKTAWNGAATVIARAAHAHVDVGVPNFGLFEWTPLTEAEQDVFSTSLSVADGRVETGEAPGLGCDVDVRAAARFPYR